MQNKAKSFLEILLLSLFIIVFLVFNPWTYIALLFLFVIWNAFGIMGKIIIGFIIICVGITLYIVFEERPEEFGEILDSKK